MYLFLCFDGALEIRLNARLEVFNLLSLKTLQFAAHQPAHVVEQEPSLVDSALGVGDISAELIEAVLLRATLSQELILVGFALLQLLLSCVPRVVRLLSLLEGRLHGANEPDILVDHNTHCEDVLLRLPLVQFANSNLDIREAVKGT